MEELYSLSTNYFPPQTGTYTHIHKRLCAVYACTQACGAVHIHMHTHVQIHVTHTYMYATYTRAHLYIHVNQPPLSHMPGPLDMSLVLIPLLILCLSTILPHSSLLLLPSALPCPMGVWLETPHPLHSSQMPNMFPTARRHRIQASPQGLPSSASNLRVCPCLLTYPGFLQPKGTFAPLGWQLLFPNRDSNPLPTESPPTQ